MSIIDNKGISCYNFFNKNIIKKTKSIGGKNGYFRSKKGYDRDKGEINWD